MTNTHDVYYEFIMVMEDKALPKLKSAFENLITSLEVARLPFWLCGEFCYSEYIEPRMSTVFELLVCSSKKSLLNTIPTLTYDALLDCYTHTRCYNSNTPYTFRIFICSPNSELIPKKAKTIEAFGVSELPLLPIDNWVAHEKQRLCTKIKESERLMLRTHFYAILEKGLPISERSKKMILDELNLSYEDDSIEQLKSGLSWAQVQALKLKRQKENQDS